MGESAVKSLLLLRRNDMKQERGKEEGEEEGGAGVLMRDVVLFSLTGSAAKNCLREEGVPCDVLSRRDASGGNERKGGGVGS